MTRTDRWIALIAILAVVAIWAASALGYLTPDRKQDASTVPGITADRPAGGDFTLQGPTGPVSLTDFRGKVVLIYFGYTFCPDVCPTALIRNAQALSSLAPEDAEKIRGILVSIDPARDTPDILKVYAPYFHPNFVGLTGTPEQLAAVARQYGVRYRKHAPDKDGQYAVDHSSDTYLVAPDGRFHGSIPHSTPAPALAQTLREVLAQPPVKP